MTERQAFTLNNEKIKHATAITLLHPENYVSKGIFFRKIFPIFQLVKFPFLTPVKMGKHTRASLKN